MPFQITAQGLETQTQGEIFDELAGRLQSVFGINVNVDPSSNFGQIANIFAEELSRYQQTALAVYRSFDPNGASGVSLDRLAALTGSLREGATSSVVDMDLTFSAAAVVPNGHLIELDATGTQWQLINGPVNAPGAGTFPGQYQAVDTGPLQAAAGSTWTILAPIAGLDSVSNPTDAEVGQDQQSDPQFRQTRQIELFQRGNGPLGAISARVSEVDGVTFARTYHNPSTQPTDADGIPFKAFNVVVQTSPSPPPVALQQTIFQTIWEAQAAGGEAYGTDFSGFATDSEGSAQPVAFDLVSVIDIFITIELSTALAEDPLTPNIEDVVADAVLEVANAEHQVVGRDVLSLDYATVIGNLKAAGEIGGFNIAEVGVGDGGFPPVTAEVAPIGIRQIADFDSTRIQVTVV